MDVVITGRRTEVSERFKRQAEEKLSKVPQFAPRAHRVDVELSHEPNPRQSSVRDKVEITVRGRGPVIRAEACAEEPYTALDIAFGKLLERLRRLGDRRKVHHGRQTPPSVRDTVVVETVPGRPRSNGESARAGAAAAPSGAGLGEDDLPDGVPDHADLPEGDRYLADGPVVIRTKDHDAVPMTVEQALYEMELVGHDFFLFVDVSCGRPSVVYRRRGWNYGVIRLNLDAPDPAQPRTDGERAPAAEQTVTA